MFQDAINIKITNELLLLLPILSLHSSVCILHFTSTSHFRVAEFHVLSGHCVRQCRPGVTQVTDGLRDSSGAWVLFVSLNRMGNTVN